MTDSTIILASASLAGFLVALIAGLLWVRRSRHETVDDSETWELIGAANRQLEE